MILKVKLKQWDKNSFKYFEEELKKLFPKNKVIHFGSTAVPGMNYRDNKSKFVEKTMRGLHA